MAVQETDNNSSSGFSVSKLVRYVISLVFLVIVGVLIGLGVSSLLQDSDYSSIISKIDKATPPPVPLPVNISRTSGAQSARKTGITYFEKGSITFCDSSGSVTEDTDSNGYPNGVKNLITSVYSTNKNEVTVTTDVPGETKTYSSPEVYIQESNELNDKLVVYVGTVGDLETGDCVVIKNYETQRKASIYGFI